MSKIVIVESPYAGNVEANLEYARAACLDCFKRGEVPFASHLLFTQMLDDGNPLERELGIKSGYEFWPAASRIVFYVDRGWSPGMQAAKGLAIRHNFIWEARKLNE